MKKGIIAKIMGLAFLAAAACGLLLYLASYFWGGLLALAGLALYGLSRSLGRGKQGLSELGTAVRSAMRSALIPVLGIGSAFILGALVMLATGYDPLASYGALFYGGLVRNWHISVLNATPLIFTGLAIALAFKAGLFNIGAEGQYFMGVMVATWLGQRLSLPPALAIPLIFAAAMAAGAGANIIPAILKIKTGAHEVVTTMMFAYAIKTLSPMFIRANGGDPALTSHPYTTDPIKEAYFLPFFKDVLPNANYRLHIGIIIAIVAAILVAFLLDRTDLGFKIRAVGHNPLAAKTQGISVAGITAAGLLISGALASLSGVVQVLGLDHRMFQNLNAGYGWNGISIALLAGNNPVAIIFTALLWGVLDAGGQYMARTVQTPNAIIEIVKSVILFLMLARVIYERAGEGMRAGAARWRAARMERKTGVEGGQA